jgi:hypothetical protein
MVDCYSFVGIFVLLNFSLLVSEGVVAKDAGFGSTCIRYIIICVSGGCSGYS